MTSEPGSRAATDVDPTGAGPLLDGEAGADVHDVSDVRHWLAVYTELVNHKERLLALSATHRQRLSSIAYLKASARLDHDLTGRLEGYRRRRSFWVLRLAALPG